MSTQYVCQNCQALYKPPRRKNGVCKTCSDVANEAVTKVDGVIATELAALKALIATEQEALKNRHAIELAAAKERAELRRQNVRTIALLKRYQPPSTNHNLRIIK